MRNKQVCLDRWPCLFPIMVDHRPVIFLKQWTRKHTNLIHYWIVLMFSWIRYIYMDWCQCRTGQTGNSGDVWRAFYLSRGFLRLSMNDVLLEGVMGLSRNRTWEGLEVMDVWALSIFWVTLRFTTLHLQHVVQLRLVHVKMLIFWTTPS